MADKTDGGLSWQSAWSGPRTIIIPPKTDQGYGFTLHHFIVYPPEFVISQERFQQEDTGIDENDPHGHLYKRPKLRGHEPMETIFVKYVKEGSISHKAGLNTGDRILSVNDVPVTGKSYAQVIGLIKSSENSLLKLDILPKDEDILQMAYKGTTGSLMQDSAQSSHSRSSSSNSGSSGSVSHLRIKGQSAYNPVSLTTDNAPLYGGRVGRYSRDRERRLSASSVDELADAAEQRYLYTSENRNRKMKSSTSYTSGLSIYPRDTAPRNNNGTNGAEYFKHQFMDKRRQFEIRCKENQDTSGPNTYSSLGLFYPSSPSRKENKTASSENVTSSVYRRPRDNVLHSNDSQENISRSGSRPQGRIIPLEHRSPSREGQLYQSQDKMNIGSSLGYSPSSASSSSSSRHSYPDSSAALSVQSSSTLPHSYTSQSSIPSENLKSEHHLTRHYVPVVSSSASPKMSASVDNLDSRNPHYTPERNLRSNFNTHFYEKPNQNCGPRTFIVEIGNKTIEAGGSGNLSTGQPSSTTTVQLPNYGTAFALTKSPMATQIEVKKNNDTVLNRKKQFENGQTDSLQTAPNYNRYKTEIRKITSQGKFTSVANRLENYAKATDGKVQIRRMSSTERYSSPEPSSSGGQSERSTPQPQQPPYQDSAPIRIYVSQGTPNAPASPIVEILPMSVYQDQNQITSQPQGEVTMAKPSVHLQGDVVDGRMISDMDSLCEESVMSKPVLRKPSFLAAVNSQNRYSASHEHEMQCPDSPPTSSWMGSHTSVNSQNTIISFSSMNSGIMPPSSDEGLALTSTPIKDSTISPVILRKKSDSTPDEDAIKLQRRTSYLMATAKDRDSHKLSLDKSVSPNQSVTEFQGSPFNLTPPKQLSMKKLKSFFGEKTPRILEATEKRQDPASPIQEVAKEGTLYCKTDKVDGKRSSDRSWRPVWVELRGHALYLHKDKKEPGTHHPFSFDDQPISIKSSIVDIAYDYSQKKTVKKNVFRLKIYNGSEYLFQTEDHESMMSWIQAIQNNNNPDSDEYGLGSADLIIRKTSQYSESQPQGPPAPTQKTSPQALPKATKKLTGISLKSKIPHSPSLKRKKTESKDDTAKPKTFKGKFKILRKHQLGSSGTANSDEAEVTGMFGVPLQCCIPSPNNDFVPMIVDLCTKIVEARGLEVTGVYRVPGNTAAVHMMQEELNKGIDNMNVDHDKWCDVNVISSLLKAFFRNLPDPLITSELYQKVINSYRLEDPEKRMLKLKFLLHELPEHHFETFKHMAEHLNKVASYGHINKMDSKNLALMFGPTLIRQNDDDMATIVKDMSDQCRIVESIILHHDWYFASWDQDSYVPVDEQTEEIQHPTNPSVSKMSCDDDDNTVNPKEIVSSIVQAANRKLRGKGMDEVDSSLPLTTYKEKDIDKEIAKHNRMKAQAETARSSPNLITVSSSSQDQPMVKVVTRKSENSSDRRMAKSQEIIDTGWDFMDPDRQSQSMYINTRHFSSDSLDKNDDLELSSHGTLSGTYSVSRDTIDRLRKIEEEARLLREKEEKRQRDFQRRKIERQKLEQDIQRTKKEIEIEDSQNVDDLLNAPGHMWHSSAELYRYGGGSTRTDTPSVTSDYSSLSSITADNHTQSRHKYIGSSIPDFSSTNPSPYSLVNLQKSRSREASSQDQKPGGKYFVIQSVSSSKHSNGGNEVSSVMHSSKSSETPPTKPRNSVERILDVANEERLPQTARVVGKRKERQRRTMRDSSEHLRHSRGSLNRSNSMRRGSLDSLIDLYDRHDGRISTVSSDSEDGSDLLSDLTSTFDQKLQVLVNPKYKLNGSATKLNKSDGSASVEQNAHMKLPPQLPLSHCNKHGLCSSNDMLEKQYRDPSLHRSPSTKGETKIGIAYRFERNPSNNALGSNSSRESLSSLHSGSVSTTPAIATEPRTSYMVVNPSPVTLFDPRQKSFGFMTSSPLSLTHSSTLKTDLSVSNNGKDNRPISKSEKTEVNVTLSKQVRDGHSSTDKSKGLLRTFDLEKARSTSPEHEVVKRKGQRSKRRHTVGSTNEVEHFRALAALCQPKSENRKSAWEQLQPVVKDTNTSANKDMLSWLRNERLRGSVPDLSTAADSHVKFS